MPELPEVQVVVSTLQQQLGNCRISDVEVFWDNIIAMDVEEFKHRLIDETIQQYRRIGKYLIFECSRGIWVAHLRMEGKFYIYSQPHPKDKHTHVIFQLADGRQLHYHDTRKFGKMAFYYFDEEKTMLKNIGLDVFDEHLDALQLYRQWHQRKIRLKAMLLDQSFMAGIGNIYADEICFSCNLHPASWVYRLSRKDFEQILFHARRIMEGAIRSGGTTIRSYTSSLQVSGRFQLYLKVHQQVGKPCPACGEKIIKCKVAGRGTYLCPNCQKRK